MSVVIPIRARAAVVMVGAVVAAVSVNSAAMADTSTAEPVTGLPFVDSVDFSDAQPDTEVTECTGGLPTVWYSFTPSSAGTFVAFIPPDEVGYPVSLTVVSGEPGNLSTLQCDAGRRALIDGSVGETYYVGVTDTETLGGTDVVQLELVLEPPNFEIELGAVSAVIGTAPGTVVLTGQLSCNLDGAFFVVGTVEQRQGLNIRRGDFEMYGECAAGDTASWSGTVTSPNVWLPKPSTINLYTGGCDRLSCDDDSLTTTLRVRRR